MKICKTVILPSIIDIHRSGGNSDGTNDIFGQALAMNGSFLYALSQT